MRCGSVRIHVKDMEMGSSHENEDGPWEYGVDEKISSSAVSNV